MAMTRRDALKAGVGVGVAAAFGGPAAFAQSGNLILKPIPSSGEMIPPIDNMP